MAVYDINRILVPEAPPEYEDHTRDVHYVPAPCQVACPIGTDAPSYIAHIWDENYEGSEHEILCGSVIAAVGRRGLCEELDRAEMMGRGRVRTEWDSMWTSDPKVFAAGDGAFVPLDLELPRFLHQVHELRAPVGPGVELRVRRANVAADDAERDPIVVVAPHRSPDERDRLRWRLLLRRLHGFRLVRSRRRRSLRRCARLAPGGGLLCRGPVSHGFTLPGTISVSKPLPIAEQVLDERAMVWRPTSPATATAPSPSPDSGCGSGDAWG